MPEQDIQVVAAEANEKWVSRVLSTGIAISGSIVLLKLIGDDHIKWKDITISTSQSWIFALLFTGAHLYTTILLVSSLKAVWNKSTAHDRRMLARKIIATGGLFMRGLIARTKVINKPNSVYVRYRMDIRDPSAWASQLALPILVLAIVPFKLSLSLLLFIPIAVVIAEVNWIIGSHWAVALSDLLSTKSKSGYFTELEKGSLCVVAIASESGDYSFGHIPFLGLLAWLGIQTIVLAIATPIKIVLLLYDFFRINFLHKTRRD